MTPISPVSTGIHIRPNNSRVLVRAFIPGDRSSILRIIERAMVLSEDEIATRLQQLHVHFDARHQGLGKVWLRHYDKIKGHVPHNDSLSDERRLYIGALFSGEYALESAALFNPSIVPHPDQGGLSTGEFRFIMSLRATGEGHISSIAFRTGVIRGDHAIVMEEPSRFVTAPDLKADPSFRRVTFFHKLHEMDFDSVWTRELMQSLGDRFTRSEMNSAIRTAGGATREASRAARRTVECMRWLAEVNYEVDFTPAVALSERVIFPSSPTESNGMEDARFVHFTNDDGSVTYYATYTAYNGRAILPQLLETQDFLNFRASTLNGPSARNKGMALFPRKIHGKYAMISRHDEENLFLMYSDDIHLWQDALLLRRPREEWEAVKIGNCGSPIETEAGWLVLTHGVGPMRRYCIGAMLLQLEDPSIVLGHLVMPLIEPDEPVRNGYVPNVVYTCGAMAHAGKLILPYGLSDTSTAISTVDLAELIAALKPVG